MPRSQPRSAERAAALPFWLLAAFLLILFIAGGASRADVLGQPLVRFFAWGILIGFVLFARSFRWPDAGPALLLGAATLVVVLQLIPLPPGWWSNLPGRQILAEAAIVTGQPQPWRPLSMSPGATVNALGSLIVPALILLLAAQLSREQQRQGVTLMLVLVLVGSLLALLQFSGGRLDNPFINDPPGAVAGNFANRNHMALFLAIGCLIAPFWAFRGDKVGRWRVVAGIGLLPLLLLVILATGSRTGIALGLAGTVLGLAISWRTLTRELQALPGKLRLSLFGGFAAAVVGVLVLSFTRGRAVAVDRALALESAEDLRTQVLPTILAMLERYFPAGSGFGTFDPVYRITEPDALLQPNYLNQAHNDWLGVLLDGGLAGALVLAAAVGWWAVASVRAWRARPPRDLPRIGSSVILLVFLASIVDYPARTPMIMGLIALAATWLASNGSSTKREGGRQP